MNNLNKSLFSLLSLVTLSLLFCLPFMVSYHKWPEPNFYNQTLAVVLGLLSLLVFIKPTTAKLPFPVTALVPALLSLLLALQWFVGIGLYWQETMLAILFLWWSVLLMLAVARLKEVYGLETLVQWLAYALLLGGLFNLAVVVMQLFDADHFFWTFSMTRGIYGGNLAQVNHMTDYLSLAMASLLYLHLKGHFKIKTVIFLLLPFLLALSLTGSRMSWLYVLMISASFYIFAKRSDHPLWRAKAGQIVWLPVAYGLVQFALPPVLAFVFQDLIKLPPVPAERLIAFATQHSMRMDLIKEGLAIFSAHPWLGVGWGQYPWYDLLYADTHAHHHGFISHTHNLYVQLLAECGIFACLIVLIGSIYWLVQLLKQPNSIERWWVLLIAGIIFAHAMLEYPLWYVHFLGVFVALLALGDQRVELNLFKPIVPSIAAAAIALLSLGLVINTSQEYKRIEFWINAYPKLSSQQRLMMLNEMSALYQETLMARPLHMVLTRAYSVLPNASAPLKAKIAKYESVLHYVQADQDIYRYVLLLAADGQMAKAKTFLKRGYTRQPGYAKEFDAELQKLLNRPSNKDNPRLLELRQTLHALQQAQT